ncbi:disks large-associated protein 1-like [Oncorhynchus kisutch]|uniref:disks large-associated protein 1-like n=1 Tax=Oncorhynchus kisutch TaxID=8019 RepID=UPI0012DDBFED|nr:disks large-associated protein 1-like [Oncorhynchus kisutch]
MTMKGLSSSRRHHHMVTCDPSYDSMTLGRQARPYPLNPGNAHPADHPYYAQRSSFQSECGPYPDPASSTFPRRHYSSHHELKDECAVVPYTGGQGGGVKNNRIPPNLLEQFERQAPARHDGYHTLQYKCTAVARQRSDSPGRIRHLVHSVQKLFTKSQSLEGPSGDRMNGGKASSDDPPSHSGTLKHNSKRSKSKDRSRSEPKMRSAISGYWSSDDTLDREVCLYHHHSPIPGGMPSGVMTMGRHPGKSQSQYFMEQYNTISAHSLKTSRSNNDVKCSTCAGLPGLGTGMDGNGQLLKKSSWSSTLTVSRAREVYQKASVNLDKAPVKADTCQRGGRQICQFLQVPQDEWSRGFLSVGKDEEIPCRRMRSGSYIKAMAEEDSGDSDCSPKPSPKVQARRASYLKATQPSLTEMTTLKISTESHSPKLQIRSHSYLRAVSEVSINRSLDSLDPAGLLASPKFRSRNESYMRAMRTISQVSEVEVNGQIEAVCESVFSEMESQAVDALDLPMSGCFRMRSHSYVRAIEKGCSQDEEDRVTMVGGNMRAISAPRATTTVRTIQSSTVSSCITTYKKTPPPVPPRTTPPKPVISITAQSSTESAQDAYMDEGSGLRTRISTSQPHLSNSTESIDSMKALTAAIEAANAQVHGPASQHVTNSTITVTATATTTASSDSKRDSLRKCLSIGIQVDGPEEVRATEEHSKFQSVGIQVEEERCYRRMTRSNSVTTAVQADLDDPDYYPADAPEMAMRHSATMPRQYSRDSATSTVSIQGSGNHYHALTVEEYGEVGVDPSILPPPDPWMDQVEGPMEVVEGRGSLCPRDGRWFLKLLQAEMERMEGWCRQMEQEEMENKLPDEILGKIRSAVGSAQLLMSQKFQQFRELCEENLNPNANPRPISQDLAGFWDMLQLSIENISLKFDELHQLKANNWRAPDPPVIKERRFAPPVPKKPHRGHPPLARDRSLESSVRQRLEARKRLLAAKRALAVRQSSVTESTADSIEIYIPEAQTRL